MTNLSIQQTVENAIERWETGEAFLFTRGYKKEARVLRETVPLLIEGLQLVKDGNTLSDLLTINSMQRMIQQANELLLTATKLEVNKSL